MECFFCHQLCPFLPPSLLTFIPPSYRSPPPPHSSLSSTAHAATSSLISIVPQIFNAAVPKKNTIKPKGRKKGSLHQIHSISYPLSLIFSGNFSDLLLISIQNGACFVSFFIRFIAQSMPRDHEADESGLFLLNFQSQF